MPVRHVLALSALALAVQSAPASGATLTRDGSTLTFTAAPGEENSTSLFGDPDTSQILLTTVGDAIPYPLPADCDDTDSNQNQSPASAVECTNVTAITLDLGDLDDIGTMTGSFDNLTWIGGDGLDSLTGAGGRQTLQGGPGADDLVGAAGDDTISGGDGSDNISGGGGIDTADGGAGPDDITGGLEGDVLGGGAGGDEIGGGDGDDQIDGGDDADVLDGDAGDDTVLGGAGPDELYDHDGAGGGRDVLRGGAGTDYVYYGAAGPGGETYEGGDGIDMFAVADTTTASQVVDLGAQSAMGRAAPDALAGFEDIVSFYSGTAITLIGSAGPNVLGSYAGHHTVNPAAGSDLVQMGTGNDTVDLRDGYADRATCGDGADTVQADTLDVVGDDCESVTVSNAGNANDAPEDAPPAVTIGAPAPAAVLSTTTPNVITANATDDRGIKHVVFSTGERVLCTDTTAPYSCAYTPTSADVGRDTLVVTAVDTADQTATAVRVVSVPRFAATSLSASTSPKRDRRAPYRFTTRGRLSLPAGVAPAAGCRGTVAVTFKAGSKTVSTRRVALRPDCTYRSRVTFRLSSRLNPRTLNVVTVFSGNAVLDGIRARRHSVRPR